MRWAGHVARMEDRRGVSRILVGAAEGRRLLGRLNHRWEDNIKAGLLGLRIGTVGGHL